MCLQWQVAIVHNVLMLTKCQFDPWRGWVGRGCGSWILKQATVWRSCGDGCRHDTDETSNYLPNGRVREEGRGDEEGGRQRAGHMKNWMLCLGKKRRHKGRCCTCHFVLFVITGWWQWNKCLVSILQIQHSCTTMLCVWMDQWWVRLSGGSKSKFPVLSISHRSTLCDDAWMIVLIWNSNRWGESRKWHHATQHLKFSLQNCPHMKAECLFSCFTSHNWIRCSVFAINLFGHVYPAWWFLQSQNRRRNQ